MKHTVKTTGVTLKDKTKAGRAKFAAGLREGISNYIRLMTSYIDQITATGQAGQGEIAKVTGTLVDSGKLAVASSIATDEGFTAVWGFDKGKAPYGHWVNYGRPPGYAPIEVIKEWCRSVGIPEEAAYAIVNKLADVGYVGKHFFEPGIIKMKQTLRQQLAMAFTARGLKVSVNIK